MILFECCRSCKPPKRTANCHTTCEAYKKDKVLLDERNKRIIESKKLNSYFISKKVPNNRQY